MGLRLSVLPERFAVCRLGPDAEPPDWATTGRFFSITKTVEELSVVVDEACIPTDVRAERGWRALRIKGPIPFSAVGILAGIVTPLAQAGISLFVVSTFDTDYILVKADRLETASMALEAGGHVME